MTWSSRHTGRGDSPRMSSPPGTTRPRGGMPRPPEEQGLPGAMRRPSGREGPSTSTPDVRKENSRGAREGAPREPSGLGRILKIPGSPSVIDLVLAVVVFLPDSDGLGTQQHQLGDGSLLDGLGELGIDEVVVEIAVFLRILDLRAVD